MQSAPCCGELLLHVPDVLLEAPPPRLVADEGVSPPRTKGHRVADRVLDDGALFVLAANETTNNMHHAR